MGHDIYLSLVENIRDFPPFIFIFSFDAFKVQVNSTSWYVFQFHVLLQGYIKNKTTCNKTLCNGKSTFKAVCDSLQALLINSRSSEKSYVSSTNISLTKKESDTCAQTLMNIRRKYET